MNMEKTPRITKAQRFEDIKAMLNDEPIVYGTDKKAALDFIDHEMELLARKNTSGEKKPTKTQEENAVHKERVLTFLRVQTEGVTVTQVMKGVPEFADFSNQKVARLIKDLMDCGKVHKEIVKGKSLFTIA